MKKAIALIVCLCLTLCLLGGCGDTPASSTDSDSKNETIIEVVDFIGKTEKAVTENAEYEELYNFEVVYDYSSDYEKGTVCAQLPEKGDTFKEKPTITLTVSQGPKIVAVPDVLNKALEEARTELEAIGFSVIVYQEPHDTVKSGLVYKVDPVAGTDVVNDSEVTIYVSTGPAVSEYAELPDLVGLDQAEAERLLVEAGLYLGSVTEEYSDTMNAGYIVSMSPESGTVTFGTAVDVVISKGPM